MALRVKKRLRVAIVGPYPALGQPPRGGVQTAVWNLCEALRARDDVDLLVVAVNSANETSGQLREKDVVRVVHRGGFRGWFQVFHQEIPRVLRHNRPDIIHIQGVPSLALRIPRSVLTVHGNLAADIWHTRQRARSRRLASAACAFLLEVVPRVLISRKRTIALTGDQRGTHIPNALNPGFHARPRRDSMRFVTCGELSPLKDTMGIVDAFREVSIAQPGASLSVVGSGDAAYMKALHDRVNDLGLSQRVKFHGRLPAEEVAELLGASHCLVHFSRQENAPMVVVEALASGCAVIATDVGATRELVDGDAWSTIIAPRDREALVRAMIEALDRTDPPDSREALVKPYDRDLVAEATVDLYRRFVY